MKSLVVFSGGLDSTVLLVKMLREREEVRAITVDYGQRHRREIQAARGMTTLLGVPHNVVDLSDLKSILAGSSQTDDSVPVPHGHYAEENMKLTVVPNRNAILLSVAFAAAISFKYNTVAYAAHFGDHAIYPDCREEFCRPFSEAMRNADWHVVELERPFLKMTKADIVREGVRLGANEAMAYSYSCYEGRERHCGLCGTDVERRLAFIEAGVIDRTEYVNPLPEEYTCKKR